jgi:hypothetical protein
MIYCNTFNDILGVYSTREKAEEILERLNPCSLCIHPNIYLIREYFIEIDKKL